MSAIENLPVELKAKVVLTALDITGQTMMENRERLAVLLRDRRPQLSPSMASGAVSFALEVLALLVIDAEDNVG